VTEQSAVAVLLAQIKQNQGRSAGTPQEILPVHRGFVEGHDLKPCRKRQINGPETADIR